MSALQQMNRTFISGGVFMCPQTKQPRKRRDNATGSGTLSMFGRRDAPLLMHNIVNCINCDLLYGEGVAEAQHERCN